MSPKTQQNARCLIAITWLLMAMPSLAGEAPAAPAQMRVATVVYHIDDSARAIPLLRNLGNHRRADAKIRLVVVALGPGIDFLLAGAADANGNSYDALVDPLLLEGVEFKVCGNTLRARSLDAAKLIPDVSVVPAGVVEIARLQIEEGAAYIKP